MILISSLLFLVAGATVVAWSLLYRRERIYFSSTLSCIKEEEEITQPPEGA
jgi:hypothetical protein